MCSNHAGHLSDRERGRRREGKVGAGGGRQKGGQGRGVGSEEEGAREGRGEGGRERGRERRGGRGRADRKQLWYLIRSHVARVCV
jgi:hypothetical protein